MIIQQHGTAQVAQVAAASAAAGSASSAACTCDVPCAAGSCACEGGSSSSSRLSVRLQLARLLAELGVITLVGASKLGLG